MTTREQDALIERIALIAGRVRVEQLAGGNVSVTIVIDPDGEPVDTSERSSECLSRVPSTSSRG
jgi:hypothetical protein